MDGTVATWLTHREAAERLRVTPATVADAARRMKWPSRLRKDNTIEVEVPGEVLAEAQALAGDATPVATFDAATLEAAIKAGLQPLQTVIEVLTENLRANHAAAEILALERATAQADSAELRQKHTSDEQRIAELKPALERETRDRQTLQAQVDRAREEYHAANARTARAAAAGFQQELRREDVETEIAQLKREIEALKFRKRRWWWPR